MKWQSKTFLLFVALAAVYVYINLVVTPPRATLDTYHISSASLRILNTTVVVPVVVVWFLGLYGYQKLQEYSQQITGSKEGGLVKELAFGVLILTLWLPISSTAIAGLNLAARDNPQMVAPATILTNYLSLLFPLLALLVINSAARKLSSLSKPQAIPRNINLVALLLITAGVTYGFLVANARNELNSIYHLPLPIVLATLVVPYIFCWTLGVLAVFYLRVYSQGVPGLIFRKSWNRFAFGLVWIILCLIGLQYVTAVSAKLGTLPLGLLLGLTYGLLVLIGVGFGLLASGAKKLKMIEEV